MDKQTAIQILTDLSQGVNISSERFGVCYNFAKHPLNTKGLEICPTIFAHPYQKVFDYRELVKFWPMYSGSIHYPIPHPLVTNPEVVYDSPRAYAKWDFSTVYGQNRQSFCLFLIGELNGQP